jgi:dolichol-phosphate mannosyltransferase
MGEVVNNVATLSIIIPAYNEKYALRDVLEQIVTEQDRFEILFEIIVVDDGSNDDSPALLEELSSLEPRIKVLSHPVTRGKGCALRTGLNAASYEWILFIDADLQIPMSEFGRFEEASVDADVIIGYRRDKRYTLYRRSLSLLYRGVVGILFDLHVRDVGCPFKLFRANLLRSNFFSTNGFGFDVEFLWRLSQRGVKIKELPVQSFPRQTGVSKVTLCGLASCVRELLQLRLRC